jgi:magnesium transporter
VSRSSIELEPGGFRWIDVVDPSPKEMAGLAMEFGIHEEAVADCLDPEHLPKYEKLGNVTFLIARAWDESADPAGDSIQALTRKVALFVGPQFLLTIHRKPQPYLTRLFDGAASELLGAPADAVFMILDAAVLTYETPLQRLEDQLDQWHVALFDGKSPALEALALYKRQGSLFKRMLWATLQVFQRFTTVSERLGPVCHSLIEDTQGLHLWSDELVEEANNLLQLQFSLAAHRTNDVVKVLTIFSAFFMPLTFLVGIYGMNFHHMPELDWPFGYYWSLGLMAVTSFGVWLWFRRKGWM